MSPYLRRVAGCLLSLLMVLGVGVAFPSDPLAVTVEIYYDAAWNDITSYVLHRDKITISRGFTANGKACDPGRLKLTVNNRDGRFSPRNGASPLFGKIGRNTPIRVKVTHSAITYTRFTGEITSWPSRWDVSEQDVWAPIEAAGILRRLNRGEKPLRSALYRSMSGIQSGDIVPYIYWPMEDGENATYFAPAVFPQGSAAKALPVTFANNAVVQFAADSSIIGSEALPIFPEGTKIQFSVPEYTDTGSWVLQHVFRTLTSTTGLGILLLTNNNIQVSAILLPGSNLLLTSATDFDTGTTLFSNATGITGSDFVDQTLSIVVGSQDTVAGDDFTVRIYGTDGTLIFSETETNTGAYGRLASGVISSPDGSGDRNLVFGHVTVFTDPTFDIVNDGAEGAQAAGGWDGDSALDRFIRLCGQAHIPYTATGDSSAPMGPERTGTFVQSCIDCAATDQGLLFERRQDLGLHLRSNGSRYNQLPIVLDYGAKHIAPPLDPEPDDQQVANDREVKRRGGSSARRELSSGPLSIQDPPDGVGRYDDTITVDAHNDNQLEHIASWRLHVGTWDAERYPAVRVNLAAAPSLIPALAAADTGDLITISDLPTWLPPGDAELSIAGYTEKIGFYEWDIVFACWAGGPYNVVGVWDLLSHELHAAINSSTTSVDIATTDLAQPLLATTGLGSGYAIAVGGEQMQVTAVAASTITYGAVGAVSHANNANVTPGLPGSLAQGNLMVMLAAIRNSGTGIPDTPSGWYRFPVFPSDSNVQLFGKIAGASESGPTVSFTGGAANADTTAQIIRLAGKWHDVENVLVESNVRLNSSAQDITVPCLPNPAADNCIVLAVGWKQDDWTSVAAISGMTEIAEEDTTTGDDQGIVWDYVIQTTAASRSATSFVITGGASAISRAAVLALRCDYQTATVTRAINGTTAAAHSAADAVTTVRPMRWALT